MKKIQSLIAEAEQKSEMWKLIADDPQALTDREETREEALMLSNYFEGRADGLCDALITPLSV